MAVIAVDKLLLIMETRFKNLDKVNQLTNKFDEASLAVNKTGRLIDNTSKQFVGLGAGANRFTTSSITSLGQLEGKITQIGKLTAQGFLPKDVGAKRINDLKAQFGSLGGAIDKTFKRAGASASAFDARLLSLLFGGMALQRMFGGILRSITTTFLKAEGDTSELRRKTTELTAAWEFFKFSLFDALNTDFFTNILSGTINLIDTFSQMSDGAKQSLLAIVGGLAALGTAMLLVGQFRLLWNSVLGTGGFLAATSTMDNKMFGVTGLATKLRKLAIAGLVIKVVLDLEEFFSGEQTFEETIKDLGIALSLIGAVSGKAWVIAVGVTLVLLPFGERIRKFGEELSGKGIEQTLVGFEKSGKFEGKLSVESIKNLGSIAAGAERATRGFAIQGIGFLLESVNNLVTGMDEDLTPAIVTSTEQLVDGFKPALDETNSSMEFINETTTPLFVESSAARKEAIDNENDTLERNIELLQQIQELEGGISEPTRTTSSVSTG